MKLFCFRKARLNSRAGFTLLELLIVLFLLSLGYVTLYAAGIGGDKELASFEATKVEIRTAVRYAKRLALAKGQPIAVRVSSDKIQLLDAMGEPNIHFPINKKPYVVSSDFDLQSYVTGRSDLLLIDNETANQFFFDERGRLASRIEVADALIPLANSVKITIANSQDAQETLYVISNVTGELM